MLRAVFRLALRQTEGLIGSVIGLLGLSLSTRTNTASTRACQLWGYGHKTVCHERDEYARNEDGDGFCEVHVNTMKGFWSLFRSWLRPHRGISQDKLPLCLSVFQFVYDARRRGKALLGTLIAGLVA
jgi:hypothetical protein